MEETDEVNVEPPSNKNVSSKMNPGDCQKLRHYLQNMQENRVTLNIGGTRYETSKDILQKDQNSLFALLFIEEPPVRAVGNSVFIDRDAAYFRIILKHLRYGCTLPSPDMLPREIRYLLEIKSVCEFYRLHRLLNIVKKRLRRMPDSFDMGH